GPPQSVSVSVPSCFASLQLSTPPHVSLMLAPHVWFSDAHVAGVQPHVWLGKQVSGWHIAFVVQPVHCPPRHARPTPHADPSGNGTCRGVRVVHVPGWQPPAWTGGVSVLSATIMVPPLPSHSIFWQSPGICDGAIVVGVPDGGFVVTHVPFVQVGYR